MVHQLNISPTGHLARPYGPLTSISYDTSYAAVVSELLWRLPAEGRLAARLTDVTVAEVGEALEAPLRDQLRHRVGQDMLAIYSVTAGQRVVGVVLLRDDDSFVWRVAIVRPLGAEEFEMWLQRN